MYLPPLGRVLWSSIFIYEGIQQLLNPGGFVQYFAHANVPHADVAVWVALVIHLVGGLAILLGFKTRWAAALLAVFGLVSRFRSSPHFAAPSFANFGIEGH